MSSSQKPASILFETYPAMESLAFLNLPIFHDIGAIAKAHMLNLFAATILKHPKDQREQLKENVVTALESLANDPKHDVLNRQSARHLLNTQHEWSAEFERAFGILKTINHKEQTPKKPAAFIPDTFTMK